MDEAQLAQEVVDAMEPGIKAFICIVQDNPDAARSLVRDLSARDRAVLSFHLSELSRLVEDEEVSRTAADRKRAWLSSQSRAYPDGYDV